MPIYLPQKSRLQIPRTVWMLGFVSMLMDISSEMIHSLLPVFVTVTLGASVATLGVLEGVAEATAMIVKIFSGMLSDYIGNRKWLVALGYGMGACSKIFFPLAPTAEWIFSARFIDRVGKGIRGAPRDALIADVTPPEIRGAAFGLRQSLDTIGAFIGPLLAMGMLLFWTNNIRLIFWAAVPAAFLACLLLLWGVREPQTEQVNTQRTFPITRTALSQLSTAYWLVVMLGAILTLARFSEAFLILRAHQGGLALAWLPLVIIFMNLVYAACAYPLGKLADRVRHRTLLWIGMLPLIGADLLFAHSAAWPWVGAGLFCWGLHMAATQGLLAAMVAEVAPPTLRGTAFGVVNLVSGCAMLLASVGAGVLWDKFGAATTFYAGAAVALGALLVSRLQSD